ncbi:MAG: hypothetical protein R2762_09525 [Bryobacteraceae bacterium]
MPSAVAVLDGAAGAVAVMNPASSNPAVKLMFKVRETVLPEPVTDDPVALIEHWLLPTAPEPGMVMEPAKRAPAWPASFTRNSVPVERAKAM